MRNKKKQQLSFTTYEASIKIKKSDPLNIIFTSIDWSFILPLIKDKYVTNKELTYNPVALFRAQLLIWLGEAKSNRSLAESLRFNSRYCVLCGFDNFLKTPVHSTFSHFRKKIGKDLYYKIFHRLIAQVAVIATLNQISINSKIVHIVTYTDTGKKKSCNCGGNRCKYSRKRKQSSNDTEVKLSTKHFVVFGHKIKMIINNNSQLPVEILIKPKVENFDLKQGF